MIDIKKLRETHGLTQQDLAVKCGVSLRTVQNWEKGETIPEIALRLLKTIENEGETISSFASDNAVSVSAGRGSNVKVGTVTERFMNVVECQLQMLKKSQEQIDRLLNLLERK